MNRQNRLRVSPTVFLFLGVFTAIIGARISEAATDIPEQTIAVNTSWLAEGSPYRVLGDVTVTGGKTLTIGPGVTVEILDDHSILADVATVEIENSTITGGMLAVSDNSSSNIQFVGDTTLFEVTWNDPGAGRFRIYGSDVSACLLGDGIPKDHTLFVDGGWGHPAQLVLSGGIFRNLGTIDLQDSSVLYLESDTTLEGEGEILLGNQSIEGAEGATLTVSASQSILVGGDINVDVENLGLIEAGSSEEILFTGVTITNYGGILRGAGGSIEIADGSVEGGVLEVSDNSRSYVYFSGEVSLKDVTWSDLGSGEFRIYGEMTARLLGDPIPAGQTLVLRGGPYGETLRFELPSGSFVNHGIMELGTAVQFHVLEGAAFENNGTLELNSRSSFHIESDTSIEGTGEVVLDGGSIERTEGSVLTIGSGQRISGRGTILIDLDNRGILEGTEGNELELQTLAIANSGGRIGGGDGTVGLHNCSVDGGTLAVSDNSLSTIDFFGDVTLNDVIWEDSGAGRFRIYGSDVSARLLGDGIPKDQTLFVDGGWGHPAQLVLPGGTFWNRGTIDLQDSSVLYLESDTKLDGDGDVLLGNQTIDGAEGTTLTVGESQEVLLGGDILIDVINLGLIEVSGDDDLRFSQVDILNSGGTVRAAGGNIWLATSTVQGGILEATDDNNSLVVFDGSVSLEDVTWYDPGAGEFRIVYEASLSGDGIPAGQTLNVRGGIYGPARLILATGTLTNHGTIQPESGSDIYLATSSMIDGSGKIILAGHTITSEQEDFLLTLGERQTLEGWGDIEVPVRSLGRIENRETYSNHVLSFEQSLQVEGELAAFEGSPISVAGTLRVDDLGGFAGRPSGTIQLGGGLMGDTQNVDSFSPLETLIFDGTSSTTSPQQFEVMSEDIGNDPAGYDGSFVLDTVVLTGGVSVQLTDQSDNALGDGAEAIYVQTLIVQEGSTLDLAGFNLYARVLEIEGSVLGGEILETPDGGLLSQGAATPGRIAQVGEIDEWEFYGWKGRSIAVFVDPGSSSSLVSEPYLAYVQVDLIDPNGAVLTSAASSGSGKVAEISGTTLPADGLYTIRVQAASGHSNNVGNYKITIWDISTSDHNLVLNQVHIGQLPTPYHVDHWYFTAAAGQQVRLRRVNASSESVSFDLIGPNGWTGFSDLTTDSELAVLPTTGEYIMAVYPGTGDYDAAYAFCLEETTQIQLPEGEAYSGSLAGPGQVVLYRIDLAESMPMIITLTGASPDLRIELYARLGQPPTRETYDYRGSDSSDATQQIIISKAVQGTWYVLLYCEHTIVGGAYELLVETSEIVLTSITPERHGNGADAVLTLNGAGFEAGTIVELVGSDNSEYTADTVEIDSAAQITAIFGAGIVPAGVYTVRVTQSGGGSAELPDGFEMTGGGEANLVTQLILPSQLGYHMPATIYVEYANTGGVAMPAPLLSLTAYQGENEGALMTLDASRLVRGFWTSAIPEGFDTSVEFLASGKIPGVLQPGESERIPVYYAGWLKPWDFTYPEFNFSLASMDQNETAVIEWEIFADAFGQGEVESEAWQAILANLSNQIGETWGEYVVSLSQASARLGQLGLRVDDIAELETFLIQEADQPYGIPNLGATTDIDAQGVGPWLGFSRSFPVSISGRWRLGSFGRGWTHSWEISLTAAEDGTVTITMPEGNTRIFQPDSRGVNYFSMAGDGGSLVANSGGSFTLSEADGLSYVFNADGQLEIVEDKNGNSIAAVYANGKLSLLSHSSGQALSIAYSDAGRIISITDSLGRSVQYGYDTTEEHLITVNLPDNSSLAYEYSTGRGAAQEHALTQIDQYGLRSRFFEYDTSGRLSATYVGENIERVEFQYNSPGRVRQTDGMGGITTFDYDHRGLLLKNTDPVGAVQRFGYDEEHRFTCYTNPAGYSRTFRYNSQGNLAAFASPMGHTTGFSLATEDDGSQSVARTDPRGNTTQLEYDESGNLCSITYTDGARETWDYNELGLVSKWTNARGQSVEYTYDTLGRMTSKQYSDGSSFEYEHDERGRLLSATSGQAISPIQVSGSIKSKTKEIIGGDATTFEYDDAERSVTVTGDGGRWIEIKRDAAGRRISSEDQSGRKLFYQYNEAGHLVVMEVTDFSCDVQVYYDYDNAGRRLLKEVVDRISTNYEYDAAGNLTDLENIDLYNEKIVSKFHIDPDELNQETTVTTEDTEWRMQNDPDGRLVSVQLEGGPDAFPKETSIEYDANGNRVQMVRDGVVEDYIVSDLRDRYEQIADQILSYDADGNRVEKETSDGTTTRTYDVEGRLTSVDAPGGEKTYGYGALGYCTEGDLNGEGFEYFCDPYLGRCVEEFDAEGNCTAFNCYGPGLVGRIDGEDGEMDACTFDPWGNTCEVLDFEGETCCEYEYSPTGDFDYVADEIDQSFPFTVGGEAGVRNENDIQEDRNVTDEGTSLEKWNVRLDPASYIHYVSTFDRFQNDPFHNERLQLHFLQLEYLLKERSRNPEQDIIPLRFITSHEDSARVLSFMLKLGEMGYISKICDRWPNTSELINWLKDQIKKHWKAYLKDEMKEKTSSARSHDPNQKLGPGGYGEKGFIAVETVFPYRIDFENDPEATAPAQQVEITDQLDANLDWDTFELTEIGFGDRVIPAPQNSRNFETTVTMNSGGMDFDVHVETGIHSDTGEVYAHFRSIDPETSLPPPVDVGFLAPEDGTGAGQGHISYLIHPKSGLATGTEIRNVALIVFDQFETIATNQIDPHDPSAGSDPAKEALNTIDVTPPVSSVVSLPATVGPAFTLEWSGTDEGSGIDTYTIYVSENGSAFEPYLVDTSDTSTIFNGVVGSTYAFYSLVIDHVGLEETGKSVAETTVLVTHETEKTDLFLFIPSWMSDAGKTEYIPAVDMDGDGDVDRVDILQFYDVAKD